MDVDTDGKASDGDGRRRRSFLPAPKKTTSLAFAPSQTSLADDAPPSHSASIASSAHSGQAPPSNLFLWKAPSSSGSVVEQARTQPTRSHGHGDRMRSGRHPARHSFGVGLYVGARVKIGGVKPGILRYLGPTHFAHGTFCGIELLDEDGNHDGKVNGHRYFVCAPNHGIFAPDEKVILDTSSVSGRVPVESEDWFNGAERASRVPRSHEQGQHESTDRPKHGQNLGHHRSKHTDESAYSPHSRDARLPAYASLNASYTSGMPLESMDAHSFCEASKRGSKPERSRSSRSILEAANSQRQHPSQPYHYSKRGDPSVNYQRSSSCSSQSDASLESSLEAPDKNRNSSSDFESEQEHGRPLRRHARKSDKVSDGSRPDSAGRYALSTGVKEQLRSDSKQYLNFTFDELNRSMDSDGFERGGTFDYQDFAMAANCGGSSGVHFPHGPSLDMLSHEGLDLYLAGQATHSCSERLDGAKREGTGLSKSGVSHRSGGNAGDSGVYSMTARCPLCSSSLSKEMLSSGSHVCEFGTSSTGGYVLRRRGGGGGTGGAGKLVPSPVICELEGSAVRSQTKSHSSTVLEGDTEIRSDKTSRGHDINRISSHTNLSPAPDLSSTPRKCKPMKGAVTNEGGKTGTSSTEPPKPGTHKGGNGDASSERISPDVSLGLEWDYGQDVDEGMSAGDQDSTMTASYSSATSESLSEDPGLREMETSDQYATFSNEYGHIDALHSSSGSGGYSRQVMSKSCKNKVSPRVDDTTSLHEDTSSSTGCSVVVKCAATDDGSVIGSTAIGRRHKELGTNKDGTALRKMDRHLSATSCTSIDTDADTEDEDDEEDDQQQSGTNQAVLGTKVASAGTNDEDEDSSEPTGNTEDERIEADQSTVQDPTIAALAAALGEILKSQSSNKPRDANKGLQDQELDSCLVSTGSGSKEDDQSPSKDEANSMGKARRAVKITRKRSENIDHKMPNINVTSRLADYIKAPVPVKTTEEKENELKKKQKKNVKNISNNRSNLTTVSQSMLNLATSRASSLDEGRNRTRVERPEVPKPIIKKTPRKNKWDNIMSQIEANKDKPKPVTEVKSSLAAYLSAPPPQDAETDQPPRLHRKEAKSKIKELPPPLPKIDFSKIKSKLNVPTAASAIKAMPKRELEPKARKAKPSSKDKSPLASPVNATHEGMVHDRRVSEGSVALELHSIREEDGSVRTSPTELSDGDNTGQAPAEQGGVSSKKGPDPSQKENRRPSSAGGKSDVGDKIQATHESAALEQQLNSPTEKQNDTNYVTKADESNSREDTTNHDNTLNQHEEMSPSAAQLEHELLESLVEARAQVAGLSKMQSDLTSQAFDAMRTLFRTFNKELKTFKSPSMLQKLDTALKQLDSYVSQTANLSSQRESLDKHFTEVILEQKEAVHRARAAQDSADKESNERLTNELNDSHRAALNAQKEELSAKHEDNITSLTHFYERQIELLRQSHDRQVADITNEGKLEINSLKICHLEEVQGLRNKHEGQMEDLHQLHRNKMDDMTQRFESVKLSHSEKVESLRKQCEELAQRARNSEEALQKDSDVKVQMALAPYLSLPSEIESLKSVQEMRIEEIQKLRVKIVDLEKQLEELPIATEKIISLQQKIENLGAIISIKTEREKQLHEKCQVLMRKYDRESRANKRISMDFEQVMWRMTQSSDFGSCESLTNRQHSRSPSRAQEDTRHASFHKMSPGGRHGGVVLRVRKRSSDSISDSDRKLRSKSASFLIERNEGGNNSSPSLSPKLKQKKRSKKSPTVEISVDRMFHSAGPEFMSHLLADPSHKQKEWNRQNETTDLTTSQETTTSNMASSYARSNSGISDSGVYDSMTRSDQLNTSVASTDSEWGHTGNILVTSDRKMGDDGSGPPAGDYNCLSDGTVSDS